MPPRFATRYACLGLLALTAVAATPVGAQHRDRPPDSAHSAAKARSAAKEKSTSEVERVESLLASLRNATDAEAVDAARARLRAMADRGSTLAAYHVGRIAADGRFGPVDAAQAEQYLRMAAKGGQRDGQYALAALLLAESEGAAGTRHDEAVEWLRRSAKALPESVYLLALVKARSAADPKAAEADVVRKAAEAGYAPAQYRMAADMLLEPPEPERDRAAIDLMQRAADQGHITATLDLGIMLLEGTRIERDVARAVPLLERAAAAGEPRAEYALGRAYTTGDALASDSAKGIVLIQRAAAKRLPEAQYAMGFAYTQGIGVGVDDVKAFTWFERSAAQGYADAMFALGNAYSNGYGVGKSPARADEWYCKAAQAGHKAAIERMRVAGPAACNLSAKATTR